MFLIVKPPNNEYAFSKENPAASGYRGTVEVVLLEDKRPVPDLDVREGEKYPTASIPWLGQSRADRSLYGIFDTREECIEAEFQPVTQNFTRPPHRDLDRPSEDL